MFDVFISHSSNDRAIADAIKSRLEASSIRPWKAPDNILPGQVWEEAIARAISECKITLLVWSADSQNSQQVKRELALAASMNKVIIPLRIQDLKPEGTFAYYLTNTHWLDAFSNDEESGIGEAVDRASKILNTLCERNVFAKQVVESQDNFFAYQGAHHIVEKKSSESATGEQLWDDYSQIKTPIECDERSEIASEATAKSAIKRATEGVNNADSLHEHIFSAPVDSFHYGKIVEWNEGRGDSFYQKDDIVCEVLCFTTDKMPPFTAYVRASCELVLIEKLEGKGKQLSCGCPIFRYHKHLCSQPSPSESYQGIIKEAENRDSHHATHENTSKDIREHIFTAPADSFHYGKIAEWKEGRSNGFHQKNDIVCEVICFTTDRRPPFTDYVRASCDLVLIEKLAGQDQQLPSSCPLFRYRTH